MSVVIRLTKNRIAIVDDCDAHLANYKWFICNKSAEYAGRNIICPDGKRRTMYMHHCIIGRSINGLEVDHINGNQADNRRCNLRFVTHRMNCQNRKDYIHGLKTSKYVGVYWEKRIKKWRVKTQINGKEIYIGIFDDEEKANEAYRNRLIGQ